MILDATEVVKNIFNAKQMKVSSLNYLANERRDLGVGNVSFR